MLTTGEALGAREGKEKMCRCSLVFLLNFVVNLNLYWKIKSIKKKLGGHIGVGLFTGSQLCPMIIFYIYIFHHKIEGYMQTTVYSADTQQ